MISVLIPVFNYDVRELVGALHDQLSALGINHEIRVYDDCSSNDALNTVNDAISGFPNVVLKKLSQNLGFCGIRNLLAEEAKYDLLLFLDSDVEMIQKDFIKKYLDVRDEKTVFCGGMKYTDDPPDIPLYLKWIHGKTREEAAPEIRNKAAYRTLWAGNFLIPKKIYLAARFDDGSSRYGYNDTMFGYKLMVQEVPVVHIDNPMLHNGLMPGQKFIDRSLEAVENLLFFEQQTYIQPSFYEFIKVFQYGQLLKRVKLDGLFLRIYHSKKNRWVQNLLSPHPNLRNLDKLKLGRFLELKAF